jgi:hypothetical protein
MATIITRSGKGSPLTNAELDANFTNLNTDKIEASYSFLIGTTAVPLNRTSGALTLAGVSVGGTAANVTGTVAVANGGTGSTTAAAALTALGAQAALVSGTNIKTVNSQSILGAGNIQIDGGVTSFNTRTGAVALTSGDVTGALGFTPYNATNPSGYITSTGSISGNAATATTLQTARTINGVSFNGSANITLTAANPNAVTFNNGGAGAVSGSTYTGAAALTVSHNTVGAPSTTGTGASGTWGISISGNAATATTASALAGFTNSNVDTPVAGADAQVNNGLAYVTAVSLFGQVDGALYAQAYSGSWVHQIFGDYRTGQLAVRGRNSGAWQAWRTVLDSSNFNGFAPTLTGTGASGTWDISTTGNAATATTLQTARTINGTSFNGSANITTANWGTARTITVGATGKSVNGSANVSWTLAEIGAVGTSGDETIAGVKTFSGNMGVGVTPSAWEGSSGIDTGNAAGIAFSYTRRGMSQNVYFDGTNYRFRYTGGASLYQPGAEHFWYTAASGAAGAIATFAQRMSLDASGNLTATGDIFAFSDERLKKDWRGLGPDFLARLAKVKNGTYTRTDIDQRQVGVGAQSLREVMPEAVLDGEHLSVAYGNAALAAAVELAKELVALRAKVEALEAKLIGD